MTNELTFQNVQISPISQQNQMWIRSTELAKALGYSDETSVTKLYNRNAGEFEDDMSQVIEIADTVNSTVSKTRIFSLRGCHLVAMFARTEVAKDFRRWVLDVLESMNAQAKANPLTLTTTTTRKPLTDLVKTWSAQTGQKYSHCYRQVNAHFQLEGIAELPEEWIQDACHFVQSRIDANNQAIAIAQAEQAALPQGLADLVPIAPQQAHVCPLTPPVFTPEEMIAGGQLAKLFDKHFANLDKVIKESDHLYQHFQLWGNMGNKKLGLSPEVQMLFENGNNSMKMVKAAMFMAQHGLKSALNVKSNVAFV